MAWYECLWWQLESFINPPMMNNHSTYPSHLNIMRSSAHVTSLSCFNIVIIHMKSSFVVLRSHINQRKGVHINIKHVIVETYKSSKCWNKRNRRISWTDPNSFFNCPESLKSVLTVEDVVYLVYEGWGWCPVGSELEVCWLIFLAMSEHVQTANQRPRLWSVSQSEDRNCRPQRALGGIKCKTRTDKSLVILIKAHVPCPETMWDMGEYF